MTDYLAVVYTPYGPGSYARSSGNETKEQVAQRCRRLFEKEWGSFLKLKKGTRLKVNVVDVTDLDDVSWDNRGFFCGDKYIERHVDLVEV